MSISRIYRAAGLMACCFVLFTFTNVEGAGRYENREQTNLSPGEKEFTITAKPKVCHLNIQDASHPGSGSWGFLPKAYAAGFVCFFRGEGPLELITGPLENCSLLHLLVQTEEGEEVTLNLRGYRETYCSKRSMNSITTCQAGAGVWLIIEYLPEDNLDLPRGKLYKGALPVQARDWYHPEIENGIVMISIQT